VNYLPNVPSYHIDDADRVHRIDMSEAAVLSAPSELHYVQYHSDKETAHLSAIRQLISGDLSEPYSIYVYKYFLYQWGELCFMVVFTFE